MSYADHLKVMQSIEGGTGSLVEDQGLEQTALAKPTSFLHHISVIQEGIQAMDKHYLDIQEAWASISNPCTSVKKTVTCQLKMV